MLLNLGRGMNTPSIIGGGGGELPSAYLDGVFPETVFELNAADYTSGQTWSNRITSPYDSADQTDYDFVLGIDDGSAGDDPSHSSGAFVFGGNDGMTLKAATPPPFMSTMGLVGFGSVWTLIMTVNLSNYANNDALFASSSIAGGQNSVQIMTDTTGKIRWVHDATSYNFTSLGTGGELAKNTDIMIIISSDMDNDEVKWGVNTSTLTTTAVTTSVNSTPSTDKASIGNRLSNNTTWGANWLLANCKIRSIAAIAKYIDNTDAAAIQTYCEAQDGITYS